MGSEQVEVDISFKLILSGGEATGFLSFRDEIGSDSE
jgi:hypothetical protein